MGKVIAGISGLVAAGMIAGGGYYAGGGFEHEPKPTEAVSIDAGKVAKICGATAIKDVLAQGVNSNQNAGEIQKTAQNDVETRMAQCFDQYVTSAVANVFEKTGVPQVDVQMNLVASHGAGKKG